MFELTEFASVRNSFPALVTRPNTILYHVYQGLTESPYFETIYAEAIGQIAWEYKMTNNEVTHSHFHDTSSQEGWMEGGREGGREGRGSLYPP